MRVGCGVGCGEAGRYLAPTSIEVQEDDGARERRVDAPHRRDGLVPHDRGADESDDVDEAEPEQLTAARQQDRAERRGEVERRGEQGDP